jgi:hypothetical protein
MCVKPAVLILVGSRKGGSRRLTACRARDGHRNPLQVGKFEHKNGMHPSIQPQIYCRLDTIDRTHLQKEDLYQLGYLPGLCDRVTYTRYERRSSRRQRSKARRHPHQRRSLRTTDLRVQAMV